MAIVARLLLATILGALIGVEREYRGYPAGVRTIALLYLVSVVTVLLVLALLEASPFTKRVAEWGARGRGDDLVEGGE